MVKRYTVSNRLLIIGKGRHAADELELINTDMVLASDYDALAAAHDNAQWPQQVAELKARIATLETALDSGGIQRVTRAPHPQRDAGECLGGDPRRSSTQLVRRVDVDVELCAMNELKSPWVMSTGELTQEVIRLREALQALIAVSDHSPERTTAIAALYCIEVAETLQEAERKIYG